ncbi:tripartite tricarboxylate transporter TctB family protein [Halomonas sp. PAMB 3264]|uniref:tripartite tricarboxylate transporter TctB family protein n=1 Tax=Halomonas sp. PAMB 3264 TaxID=3075222 RepID=UPI00289A376D|nr:tripartite tricarboxylate transporter TctB family protein [Halomonas sp. PAMB 3264]WNL41502.1 tripartite tricarboxylate transporter TctB family protein [Halomonas sp. PAMB 3264]
MERDIGKPLFDIFLLIVSASAFVAASALPNVNIPGDLSASFFPQFLSALVFLLAIPCLIKDTRQWRSARGAEPSSSATSTARGVAQWGFIIAALIGYIYTFERLGYIASTALFIFLCVMGLTVISGTWTTLSKSKKGLSVLFALIFSVVLAGCIFYVFTDLFQIPLPT